LDIHEHHLGPIAAAEGTDRPEVDVGAVVRRLILFEKCTIESNRLQEIPALVSVFGVDGLLKLLDSGALQILADAMTTGQIGQTAGLQATIKRGGPLPLGSYHLAAVSMAHRRDYVHRILQEVHAAPISHIDAKRLKLALASRLLTFPADAGATGVSDTLLDLRQGHPVIWQAIRSAVMKETGHDPGQDPEMEVEELEGAGDFRVSTSLAARLGLTPDVEHRLVERGILNVAGLNQRIRVMESFEAVTGFREDEVELFAKKLSVLAARMDANHEERQFDRVITLGGLPGLEALPRGATIDTDRLLRLRAGDDGRRLRAWLRETHSQSDAAITKDFRGIREELAALTQSPPARFVRFLVATVAGFVPVAGPVAGPAVSAGDAFLLDRVIGKPGPATFLGKHYPSIFRQD
jgi:hypothetical protein